MKLTTILNWESIEDKTPKLGEFVLCYKQNDGKVDIEQCIVDTNALGELEFKCVSEECFTFKDCTHWIYISDVVTVKGKIKSQNKLTITYEV